MTAQTPPAAEKSRPPGRSGFCNPSHPKDSHDRCRKDNCPCDCGLGIHAEQAESAA